MNIVIAHGADISEAGGGTNRVTAFANGLANAGHHVIVVCPPPRKEVDRLIEDVTLETAPPNLDSVISQPVRGLSVSLKAKQVAERNEAILQFEHSSLAGIGALIGCRDYILDMHDLVFPSPLYSDLPLEPLFRQVIKQIEWRGLKHAATIVVVSDLMKQLILEEWSLPSDRFTTIPNGYSDDLVAPYQNISTQAGRVVFLGTLHPKLDLESFKMVADLPEVTELVVIGDGPMRGSLEELSERQSSLIIRGQLPDEEAFSLVASAEVAINPQERSRLQQASSPVKIYYYTALGTPMVVTKGPAIVKELEKEGAARTVGANEVFAHTVKELMTNEHQRSEIAKKAKQLSKEFTWDSRVSRLIDLYSSNPLQDNSQYPTKQ